MRYLKQSTSVLTVLGPFIDSASGTSALTTLTLSQADIRLSKNGGAFAQKSQASTCSTMENGYYSCDLNTTDSGTLGSLVVAVNESGSLAVWHDYSVVTANIWDTFFSTDQFDVNATNINGGTATTALATHATSALSTYAPTTAGTVTTHGAQASVLSAVTTAGTVLTHGAQASAITALNNLSTTDIVTQTTSALTSYAPVTSGTVLTQATSALATHAPVTTGTVLTQATSAITTYAPVTAGTVLTQAASALGTHAPATAGTVLTQATSALGTYAPTTAGTVMTHAAQASAITALNNISAADVNAEVVDAIATDTYAEPAQGAPGATVSLSTKIGHMYKGWRNKSETTSVLTSIYNDAGAVVDTKATVSDDGNTYTKEEYVSGQ